MKHPVLAALYAALIGVSIVNPALALERSGPVAEADVRAAQSYAPWTHPFGDFTLQAVAIDENAARMMVIYGLPGETSQNWSRRMMINIMGLPADKNAQRGAVLSYIAGMADYWERQEQSGKKVENKVLSGFSHTPPDVKDEDAPPPQHALYRYRIGQNVADEDNAGIIFPLEGRLVNFQLQQKNGVYVAADEVDKLSYMLMNYMDVWASANGIKVNREKKD